MEPPRVAVRRDRRVSHPATNLPPLRLCDLCVNFHDGHGAHDAHGATRQISVALVGSAALPDAKTCTTVPTQGST